MTPMGTPRTTKFDIHLKMANKDFVKILYRGIVLLINSCWLCITTSLVLLIRFFTRHVFRIKGEDTSHKDNFTFLATKEPRPLELVPEATEFKESDYDTCGEKETSSFQFKFRFQVPEDVIRSKVEPEISIGKDKSPSMRRNISKYQFLSEKNFSGFIEEPGAMTFCVQESYVDSNGDSLNDTEKLDGVLKTRFLSVKDFTKFNSSLGAVHKKEVPNNLSTGVFSTADESDESESLFLFKKQLSTKERLSEISLLGKIDGTVEVCFLSEKDFYEFDSDSEMSSVSDGYSVKNLVMDSDSDVFLSERDFGAPEHESETTKSDIMDLDGEEAELFNDTKQFGETHLQNLIETCIDFNRENVELPEELQKFEGVHLTNFHNSHTESLSSAGGFSCLKNPINCSNLCDFSKPEGELEQFLEEEMASKGTQLQNSCISNAELINLSIETYSSSVMKPMSNLNHLNDVWPEKASGDPEHKAEFLNVEETEATDICKFTEAQLPNSFNLVKESFHVGTNGFSTFKQQNNKLNHFDQVLAEKGFREPHLQPNDSDEGETEEMADTRQSKDIHMHNSQISNGLSSPTNGSLKSDAKDPYKLDQASEDFNGKETEPQRGLRKSEEIHKNKSSDLDMEDSDELESLWEHQDLIEQLKMEIKKARAIGLPTILEESESPRMDMEDSDELESLWEHQDLIEQLKMEIKKARAIGLPTILEESESPRTIEDLKPWKIDGKFLHEDPIDELHKLYKSYRERMRKFDIFNYQKMYAIGFLRLKDPLQSMSSQKPLVPTITSLLFQNFWPCRRRKSNIDPSEKFIKELQSDLEMVYVGQSCLSWEFLRWQYEKARELPESDPYGSRQYNQVAGEFQQFQVVMRRFLENEPFQVPRVPNYVKNRCVLRNLLQVPVIKEDCLKDKMDVTRKGNDAITIELLEDIMEESIGIFWEFVKADKDETPMIVKGLMGPQVELQDPTDFELMADVQASLQKKEKKLKDLLRTGNCLVKKFKKPKEDRSNQGLFFSQVDLKLVSRVLKMSRLTTDQLVWCNKKLNKITFVERELRREPSFLLFPC